MYSRVEAVVNENFSILFWILPFFSHIIFL